MLDKKPENLDGKSASYILVQPSSKVVSSGIEPTEVASESSTESKGLNKFLNLIISFNSYIIYTKVSNIVYEGDKLKVFGTFNFNSNSNRWEIDETIAVIKGEVSDFIHNLNTERVWNALSLGKSAIFCGLFVAGSVWALKGMYKTY